MKLQLSVDHFELGQKEQEYVEAKLMALEKFSIALQHKQEAVLLKVHLERKKVHSGGQDFVCRVTLSVPHAVIRAEAGGRTVEASVDVVVEKLKRQLDRYKEKHSNSVHHVSKADDLAGDMAALPELDVEAEDTSVETPQYKITRRKLFTDLYPMSEQQAITLMEAQGHGFFIFVNEDTDRYNLVYNRRNSEGYGVIELEHSHGVIEG